MGPATAPRGSRFGLGTAVVLALGSLLVLLSLGAGLLVGRFTAPASPPLSSSVVRSTPSVVVAVRELARLEGATMHVERVIDLRDRQSRFFGLVEAEDALVLVAAGEVTAGIDLRQLRDEDVEVDRAAGSVSIRLPPVELLSVRLDNDRTYVHTRQTDVLARRQESLESRARREAERTLEETAREEELTLRAQRSVIKTVESLARALGYAEVNVTVHPSRLIQRGPEN